MHPGELSARITKPVPASTGWAHTLGSVALSLLALQAVSGILLAMHYVPSPDHAASSLEYLGEEILGGRLLRSLHSWGAHLAIVAIGLHMVRVFLWAAYKRPRELLWVTGAIILLLLLALGFTGYLLPWDRKAYFATVVGTNIASKMPLLGEAVASILLGGDEVGAPTLTRFYGLHVIALPLALLLVAAFHLWLLQVHNVAPSPGSPTQVATKPFFPDHAVKDAVAVASAFALVLILALLFPAASEGAPETAPPDYEPRPDWYFLWLFELLKIFRGRLELLGTVFVPGLLVLALFLLPFLDRGPERAPRRRIGVLALGGLVFASVAGLTLASVMEDRASRKRRETATAQAAADVVFVYPGMTIDQRQGLALFRREGCYECHRVKGLGGPLAKDPTPDLAGVGGRRSRSEILCKILEPTLEKPTSYMPPHPHLSGEELDRILDYLLGVP